MHHKETRMKLEPRLLVCALSRQRHELMFVFLLCSVAFESSIPSDVLSGPISAPNVVFLLSEVKNITFLLGDGIVRASTLPPT